MTLRATLAAVILGFTSLAPGLARAAGWEEIYTAEGVTVSKMDVEGSKFVAFKGATVYDAPLGKVLYVLLDNDHRVEWVDRLYTTHIVERKNEFDYVIYQAFELPAIFSNRDYVYHGRAARDPASGVVTLKMNSIEHPKAPETVGVRAELVNSQYVLTPLENGAKTRIEVEIMTDPKGMMPAWLVNLIQRSWPLETLNGIRGQLDEPYTLVHHLPGEPPPGAGPPTRIAAEETQPPEEEPMAEAAAPAEPAN